MTAAPADEPAVRPERPWNLLELDDAAVLVALCPMWPAMIAVPIAPHVERTQRS
jgi:hypothetical protein